MPKHIQPLLGLHNLTWRRGPAATPTARMAREGEMSLNYRDNDQYRYYLGFGSAFLWLETTLRYTDVRTKKYSSVESFSGDQTYKDKAFDENRGCGRELLMPQVAVGARYRRNGAV